MALNQEVLQALITQLNGFISLFFLGLARLLPIVAMAPFFGSKTLAVPARIGFTISLFFIFFPMFSDTMDTLKWGPSLIGCVFKELFVGLILGFFAMIPFLMVQMTGVVIDNQRGSSSMTGHDVLTGGQTSAIGVFYNLVMVVIFFSLDGPFLFLDAVAKSYKVLPPDQFPSVHFFLDGSSLFWTSIIGLLGKMFALSAQLAAPALLTILMTDTFLGIMNRLAPQVQISFLGQGLKSYFGDFAILLAWFFMLQQMGKIGLGWIASFSDIITTLH